MPERIIMPSQLVPLERSASNVQISFCTTCCNRATYLQEVFAKNAQIINGDPTLEWIIVNYGSSDGLDTFMMTQLKRTSARIIYARDANPKAWHMSAAKNLAHRLGGGRILVNLDCDNFIADAVERVKTVFSHGCDVYHMWSGTFGDGSCGRIAVRNQVFYHLGGYDEAFYPMCYEDIDFLRRAHACNFSVRRAASSNQRYAISNTRAQSIANCLTPGLSWRDYNERNSQKSAVNIKNGRLTANQLGWTPTEVEVYRARRKWFRIFEQEFR